MLLTGLCVQKLQECLSILNLYVHLSFISSGPKLDKAHPSPPCTSWKQRLYQPLFVSDARATGTALALQFIYSVSSSSCCRFTQRSVPLLISQFVHPTFFCVLIPPTIDTGRGADEEACSERSVCVCGGGGNRYFCLKYKNYGLL